MTYATIMAHLDVGSPNPEVLGVAAALTRQLGARLVGIAACQPVEPVADGAYLNYIAPEIITACRDELETELARAEAEFRAVPLPADALLGWRTDESGLPLHRFIADEARSADLLITGCSPVDAMDPSRHTSIGDLVLRVGRPVLIVPASGARVPFDRIVIAWRDTREARRAVSDALPLLREAVHVTIVEIGSDADRAAATGRLADVVAWLERHGVPASPQFVATEQDQRAHLAAVLDEHQADLVVAGAFGHSRLREWMFGGVTAHLLCGKRCVLFSH